MGSVTAKLLLARVSRCDLKNTAVNKGGDRARPLMIDELIGNAKEYKPAVLMPATALA